MTEDKNVPHVPGDKWGTLDITRLFGADNGDRVRIKLTGQDGRRIAQGELSLINFAKAVMGTGAIPIRLTYLKDDAPQRDGGDEKRQGDEFNGDSDHEGHRRSPVVLMPKPTDRPVNDGLNAQGDARAALFDTVRGEGATHPSELLQNVGEIFGTLHVEQVKGTIPPVLEPVPGERGLYRGLQDGFDVT